MAKNSKHFKTKQVDLTVRNGNLYKLCKHYLKIFIHNQFNVWKSAFSLSATCRAHDIRSDLWDQKKTKQPSCIIVRLLWHCDRRPLAWTCTCMCARLYFLWQCRQTFTGGCCRGAPIPFPEPPAWKKKEKKKGGRPYYTIHQPPNSPYSSQMTFTNYFLPFLETAPWFLSGLRHAHCHVETNKLAVANVRVFFDWGGANVQTDLWRPFNGCCCVEQYG